MHFIKMFYLLQSICLLHEPPNLISVVWKPLGQWQACDEASLTTFSWACLVSRWHKVLFVFELFITARDFGAFCSFLRLISDLKQPLADLVTFLRTFCTTEPVGFCAWQSQCGSAVAMQDIWRLASSVWLNFMCYYIFCFIGIHGGYMALVSMHKLELCSNCILVSH